MNAIAAVRLDESPSGFNLLPHRVRALRSRRRRCVVEAVAAVLAGGVLAIGCATIGAPADRASARRAQIERELAREAPALAEYARLERAGQAAKGSGAQATARAHPQLSALWLALLDALSREAHSGVTVSRLEGSNAAVELQVGAADSAACVAWMDRLGRLRGVESVEMIDLKSTAAVSTAAVSTAAANAGHGAGSIEAVVRLRWRGDGETRPVRRAAYRERAVAERTSGRLGDRTGDRTGDYASDRSAR
jgi:type II secretory pathway component PulM